MLSPAELNLLSRLDLAYRRPVSGLYAGERRSPRAARSPEFADFRPYVAGDDFRQIDWRAYARLERLMLRLYVAEEESSLNIVLDASASMVVGTPPKWPAARRLAAALAFLGLSSMDRVAVGVLGDRRLRTPHLRGKDGVSRIWNFLSAIEPRGVARPAMLTELDWPRPGMTVVISDFFTEESWTAAVAGLRRRRQEPLLWQLLAPDEENPTLTGDWKLVESETDTTRELTITPGLVAEYLANLARHRSGVRRAAEGAGGRMLASLSSQELEQQLLTGMTAGVITR
ncbi:MAG: DUF58 domain-containing protein [Candidatus Dormibacteraeota bacterium]|nr:DUF58 domain-containing protein [Candidatus Dormibacteraeota bacterium]